MTNPELLTAFGAVLAIFFSSIGSSVGSVYSGTFAVRCSSSHLGWKAFIPIIIAGVLAIYGIIIAVILCSKLSAGDEDQSVLTEIDGYRNLCSGMAVGLACLSSGVGIGSFVKSLLTESTAMQVPHTTTTGSPGSSSEPLLEDNPTQVQVPIKNNSIVSIVLVLIYLEAIGLYGLIVALILAGGKSSDRTIAATE